MKPPSSGSRAFSRAHRPRPDPRRGLNRSETAHDRIRRTAPAGATCAFGDVAVVRRSRRGEWFATAAAVRSRCSSCTKQSSDTSTAGSLRSSHRTPLLLAWHCASGLGGVSDGPAPRKQSCARRRPAAIGVIQMSPKRSPNARQQDCECDRGPCPRAWRLGRFGRSVRCPRTET